MIEISETLGITCSFLEFNGAFFFPSFAIDFGMTGEFKQELRDGFIEACLHLVNRDFDALAKDFVTLGYLYLFMVPYSY